MVQQKRPFTALWVIPSLAGGGAEKAIATIIKSLDQREIRPYLCLFKKEGVFLDDLVGSGVEVLAVGENGRFNPNLVWKLSCIIRQIRPDVTIGVLRTCSMLTALAHRLAGSPGKLYLNEQNTPSVEMAQFGNAALKKIGYKPFLKMADGVLVLAEGIKQDLITNFQQPSQKLHVIPNPVDLEAAARKAKEPPPHDWLANPDCCTIVTVGRLHPQKGHDILLRAFAKLHKTKQNLRLIIVGTGADRKLLQAMAQQLGIDKAVAFVGFQPNPYAFMAHADLFVLASRYEGFGIVLAEALAVDTPAVATDCPSGPADILKNGAAGLLCPTEDPAALAAAIEQSLSNPARQQEMAEIGKKHVQQFSETAVAAQYTQFIASQHFS